MKSGKRGSTSKTAQNPVQNEMPPDQKYKTLLCVIVKLAKEAGGKFLKISSPINRSRRTWFFRSMSLKAKEVRLTEQTGRGSLALSIRNGCIKCHVTVQSPFGRRPSVAVQKSSRRLKCCQNRCKCMTADANRIECSRIGRRSFKTRNLHS